MYEREPLSQLPEHDPSQMEVTRGEAMAFRRWLRACGDQQPMQQARAAFVAHFQWFDSLSKERTERIPPTSLREVQSLLEEYFSDGMVEW